MASTSPDSSGGSTILVVSKQTGLPMETLRAWERRYGFPKPARKEGSNRRLYSDAEIARLVALKRATEAGYRIGDLVHKREEELELLARGDEPTPSTSPPRVVPFASTDELVTMLVRDDVVGLEDALRHGASALGPKRFVTDVVHPFVVAVGEGWARGRVSVGQEHLASECVNTRLRTLLSSYQDVEGRPRVLLTTLPGELHGLALSIVALYLAVKSGRPRLLGASTPPEDIVRATQRLGAEVVGLTISAAADRNETRRQLRALRKALPENVPIWLGGGGAAAVDPRGASGQLIDTWAKLDGAIDGWNASAKR